MKKSILILLSAFLGAVLTSCATEQPKADEVISIINKVNKHWQDTHPRHERSFWDNAAYHTGNMEAFFLTGDSNYYAYSKAWAEHNRVERRQIGL